MKLSKMLEQHPFKRDLELIFDLFKDDEEKIIDLDVNLTYEYGTHFVEATGWIDSAENDNSIFKHRKEIKDITDENEKRKKAKQSISFVWLQLLETVTGKHQPWGILTGIRPTKLYHSLLKKMTYDQVDELLHKEYLIDSTKVELLRSIVQRQLKVIPDLYEIGQEVSLYIGIPFCPTKCAYCTFPAYAIQGRNGTVDQFLQKLHYEIEKIGKWLHDSKRNVTTIYFGGGTPTSIEAEQLDQIFHKLAESINLANVREITVEAGRPDTITPAKLDVLNKWMVDRISINPQTFTQETLDIIGRHHTVDETIEKFKLAREMSIDNINMDLIIGLPGETSVNLQHSLQQIESLKPESLTIHTMAFKRASHLTKNKDQYEISDREEIVKMMELATKWTNRHQYHPYYLYRQKNILGNLENVGYSLANRESLYNILIMEESQTIIGLGSGAVSKLVVPNTNEIIRLPNPKEPKAYIETVRETVKKKLIKLTEIFQS